MIDTGISPQYLVPSTSHRFVYSYTKRTLETVPNVLALVGTMRSTGTATAATVVEPASTDEAITLFGASSPVAIAFAKAVETGSRLGAGPRILAVGIAEPSGGTAHARTVTFAGTATVDGVIPITIAGRTVRIGVRAGEAAATVAARASSELNARALELPVLVTVAGAVLTLTSPVKGENGADTLVDLGTPVSGITMTLATSATGSGTIDITAALDALGAVSVDVIAIENRKSADVTDVLADAAVRNAPTEKAWRQYVIGDASTLGTASALAAAANTELAIVANAEGCRSLPFEIAAAIGAMILSTDRPNANFDGFELPLAPPPAGVGYTPTEQQSALIAGVTPLAPVENPITREARDGVMRVVRLITTRTTDAGGFPFTVTRDPAPTRVGFVFARQIDIGWSQRFGAGAAREVDRLDTPETIGLAREMIVSIGEELERLAYIQGWESSSASLVVERSGSTAGRIDTDIPYVAVGPVHQLANLHRVQVALGG